MNLYVITETIFLTATLHLAEYIRSYCQSQGRITRAYDSPYTPALVFKRLSESGRKMCGGLALAAMTVDEDPTRDVIQTCSIWMWPSDNQWSITHSKLMLCLKGETICSINKIVQAGLLCHFTDFFAFHGKKYIQKIQIAYSPNL